RDWQRASRAGMLLDEEHVCASVFSPLPDCGPKFRVQVVPRARPGAMGEAHAALEQAQTELPILATARKRLVIWLAQQSRAIERGIGAREVAVRPAMAGLGSPAIVVVPPAPQRELPGATSFDAG